jgi:hypothetical protein
VGRQKDPPEKIFFLPVFAWRIKINITFAPYYIELSYVPCIVPSRRPRGGGHRQKLM